jgi:hypothetical protein
MPSTFKLVKRWQHRRAKISGTDNKMDVDKENVPDIAARHETSKNKEGNEKEEAILRQKKKKNFLISASGDTWRSFMLYSE